MRQTSLVVANVNREVRGQLAFVSERVSPMRFDPARVSSAEEVDLLLDAARQAPSAGNSQPWSFIVGMRGDEVHARLTAHLARSTASWAPDASLLIANLSHRWVEGSEFEYSEFAHYDLGQAVAHLTFQAHALGLAVHQFRGFNRAAIATEFKVPTHWEVTSMAAVGRHLEGAPSRGVSTSDRSRRSLAEITWTRSNVPGADFD